MKKFGVVCCVVGVCVFAANVNAATYTGSVEYTAGSGSNQATIAIDFDFGNSFLFNYQWDGIATGWDALAAIDTAGALDVDAIWYGEMAAHFVSDFDYAGGLEYDYGSAYAGWAYYGSTNNEIWTLKSGVDSRTLVNGCYDSWVWTNYDLNWIAIRQPGQMPIPEPVTILLFGLGGLLIRKCRA
ncbi:MAG: PEP-CTERM sorting domain-containing protein [Phycisphaerae bacterium]|nr:MAG: hypothetical protein A2Y13_10890 [Planctomycetes bacterium GWC2_45_44]HBG78207.1 hypothetical protein [Phycisphaerales bacterium]HBR18760.1 hypothetical protein [Phycisphaerales bacterium]